MASFKFTTEGTENTEERREGGKELHRGSINTHIRRNKIHNVRVHSYCLGEHNGLVRFETRTGSATGHVSSSGNVKVMMTTIDALVKDLILRCMFILALKCMVALVLAGLLGVSQPTAAAEGRFVNLSTRALVEAGEEVMIGGFIIEDGARQVLIQAVGPELVNDGISNALADPVLTVTNTTDPGNPMELMVNDNWEDSQGQLVSDLGEAVRT